MLKWLHAQVSAVCPIDGLTVDEKAESVRCQFRPEATPEQRAAAQALIDGFDWTDRHGYLNWRTARNVNRRLSDAEQLDLAAVRRALKAGQTLNTAQLSRAVFLLAKLTLA